MVTDRSRRIDHVIILFGRSALLRRDGGVKVEIYTTPEGALNASHHMVNVWTEPKKQVIPDNIKINKILDYQETEVFSLIKVLLEATEDE